MKKYIAEVIGTFVLVLFGCGSAVVAGGSLGVFGIAMAFGLSIVAPFAGAVLAALAFRLITPKMKVV